MIACPETTCLTFHKDSGLVDPNVIEQFFDILEKHSIARPPKHYDCNFPKTNPEGAPLLFRGHTSVDPFHAESDLRGEKPENKMGPIKAYTTISLAIRYHDWTTGRKSYSGLSGHMQNLNMGFMIRITGN